MYYEEELINGIWHYRTTPNGEWVEMTKEQIKTVAKPLLK